MEDNSQQQQQPKPQQPKNQFVQYRYRWVIIIVAGIMAIINGLLSNNVNPIASKMQKVYQIPTIQVNAPIYVSLLVYSLANFPANHIIDIKGLKISFIIGSSMFLASSFFAALVNKGFGLMVFSSILTGIGQPFIINCSSKIATTWFLSKNRTVATAILTASFIIGSAIGFILPTLFVDENAQGQQAKSDIFYLYAVEFLLSGLGFSAVLIFMKAQPPTLPSLGAQQPKINLMQSFKSLKSNRSMIIFTISFILMYGTFQAFGSNVNLLFKPYGFSDIEISLLAIVLLFFGVIGSITMSVYIKRTNNYRLCIRGIAISSVFCMVITIIFLNTAPYIPIMFLCVALLGFVFTPLIPISFDLGCQMTFPLGQAQVIGILNGGSMIYAFAMTIIIDLATGLKDKHDSLIVMTVFSVMIFIGCIGFFFVKVILKRKLKQGQKMVEQQTTAEQGPTIEMNEVVDKITDKLSQLTGRFDTNVTKQQKLQKISLLQKNNQLIIEGFQGLHI